MLGTFIVGAMAMAIAVPVGVAIAVWLSEFGRPTALARVAESTIEMLAGDAGGGARAVRDDLCSSSTRSAS